MSNDISIIPPTKFLDDISIPVIDVVAQEEFLQLIANPLIVTAINSIVPNSIVTINLDGNIDINGVEFSTKFKLCRRECRCGSLIFGGCQEDIPCQSGFERLPGSCECTEVKLRRNQSVPGT